MLTTEVCTIFDYKGESKKVHHVILTPNMETTIQINDRLAGFGNLTSDGRPILNMTAAQLVEQVMAVSSDNMIFPAHAWTPWFSIFGAFSGFDTVEDCYQDMTKHIHALETGLSSDAPMNWRLSKLDKFALVSNSDCHSFWPWRLGREANVFELEKFGYRQVIDAIKSNDVSHFKYTIEVDPAYGKYHWTGHRNCKVSLSPQEAIRFNNVCPVCRRELTKGVEQRVEELADRPLNFKREGVPGFLRLLPLSEIIATVLGSDSPSTQAVWKNYSLLVEKFGNEYTVLIDISREALATVVDATIAQAISQRPDDARRAPRDRGAAAGAGRRPGDRRRRHQPHRQRIAARQRRRRGRHRRHGRRHARRRARDDRRRDRPADPAGRRARDAEARGGARRRRLACRRLHRRRRGAPTRARDRHRRRRHRRARDRAAGRRHAARRRRPHPGVRRRLHARAAAAHRAARRRARRHRARAAAGHGRPLPAPRHPPPGAHAAARARAHGQSRSACRSRTSPRSSSPRSPRQSATASRCSTS